MTALIERINPWKIIRNHFFTLKNDQINRFDIFEISFVYVIIPISILFLAGVCTKLASKMPYSDLLSVFAIMGGFLVNALVLLIDKRQALQQGTPTNQADLIKETFYNTSFGILICFVAVILCGLGTFTDEKDCLIRIYSQCWSSTQIINSFILIFSWWFIHTILMVIKRLNTVFERRIR